MRALTEFSANKHLRKDASLKRQIALQKQIMSQQSLIHDEDLVSPENESEGMLDEVPEGSDPAETVGILEDSEDFVEHQTRV